MVGGSSEEQKKLKKSGKDTSQTQEWSILVPRKTSTSQEASLTKQVELQGNKRALYKKLKQGEATKDKFRSTAQT